MTMTLSEFDYELPPERIANVPARPRDSSRLMKVNRATGVISHHVFRELPQLLTRGDLLLLNNTRVTPARLYGHRDGGTGLIEVLLVNANPDGSWDALVRPSKKIKPGTVITLSSNVRATAVARHDELHRIRFQTDPEAVHRYISEAGFPPLPPYIKAEDARALRDDYQTVYAEYDGAIAAPTAGLHFTKDVLSELDRSGVQRAFLTLHVGLGTFQPVREGLVAQHHMHPERFTLSPDTANAVNEAKRLGNRVIAVGTTSTRVLEACASGGQVSAREGATDLFITPGWRFQIIDALITNFHLPKSTLLMLVSAFAGRELILRAYREAIELHYRFYSFGDAMLIE